MTNYHTDLSCLAQAARLDHLESVFRLPGEEPVQPASATNGVGQFDDADDEECEVMEGEDGETEE